MSPRQLCSHNPCQMPSIFRVLPCHSVRQQLGLCPIRLVSPVSAFTGVLTGVLLVLLCVYFLLVNTARSSRVPVLLGVCHSNVLQRLTWQ